MTNTENNVAAQAGDEPMRAAFEAYFSDEGQSPKAIEKTFDGQYRLASAASAWRTWQACWPVDKISPCATADVERLRDLASRLREHNDPRLYYEADILMSEAADVIDAAIATTKPGA